MQDVLRAAAKHVEHVFEGLHPGFVGLGLFGRIYGMEGRAELSDVRHDLGVHGVGQDDQRDLLRDPGKARRHVRMRTPARHPGVDHLGILFPERHPVTPAGPLQRIVDHLVIGLPVAEDLVQPVGGEVPDELEHRRLVHAIAVEIARRLRHLEIDQRAVAVEGDVFRADDRHLTCPRFGAGEADLVMADHKLTRRAGAG